MKNMFVFKALLFSAVALGVSVLTGWAGDSAWSVDSNGNWSDVGNWDNGVPGSVFVDTLDMATFANILSADRVVAVDDERHIGGITFGLPLIGVSSPRSALEL